MLDDLNGSRADNNDENGRKDKEYQGEDQLDSGFCRGCLGELTALYPHGFGVDPQCLGEAGPESVGLRQFGTNIQLNS